MKSEKDIAIIYNRYVDDLYTYGVYLGFENEIVKDAIHDLFLKFSTDNTLVSGISNIRFYLFKSLKNRLYDLFKNKKEQVGLSDVDQNAVFPFQFTVTVEDHYIDDETRRLIQKQIEEMLDSLTDRQREIVYLRYIQEYDYPQISQLLGISIHGCRKLLSRAMQELRNKYGVLLILFTLA